MSEEDWQTIDKALDLGMQAWRSSQAFTFDAAFAAANRRELYEKDLEAEIEGMKRPDIEDMQARIAELQEALRGSLRVATWLSGSTDFSKGGYGYLGFEKMKPTLERARAILDGRVTDTPSR